MSNALVSICIPTYNGDKYLEECLQSAINQTYKNIEILIVDDNSLDNTWNIINRYSSLDKRIKSYRNTINSGLVNNWNKCLQFATGEWIKFLFQDDSLMNNCIEVMMNSVRNDTTILTSKRTFIIENNIDNVTKEYYENRIVTFEKLGLKSVKPTTIKPSEVSVMAIENICLNFIGEPTCILFKKDVLNELGVFNPDLSQIGDLEYFLRIASKYGIEYVPQALTSFRIHAHSTTSSNLMLNSYILSNIDTIIMPRQLLYDKQYEQFRNALSMVQKFKLNLFFRVRVYESFLAANNSSEENRKKFITVAEKYPQIEKHSKPSVFIKLLLSVVKIRRQLRTG